MTREDLYIGIVLEEGWCGVLQSRSTIPRPGGRSSTRAISVVLADSCPLARQRFPNTWPHLTMSINATSLACSVSLHAQRMARSLALVRVAGFHGGPPEAPVACAVPGGHRANRGERRMRVADRATHAGRSLAGAGVANELPSCGSGPFFYFSATPALRTVPFSYQGEQSPPTTEGVTMLRSVVLA